MRSRRRTALTYLYENFHTKKECFHSKLKCVNAEPLCPTRRQLYRLLSPLVNACVYTPLLCQGRYREH